MLFGAADAAEIFALDFDMKVALPALFRTNMSGVLGRKIGYFQQRGVKSFTQLVFYDFLHIFHGCYEAQTAAQHKIVSCSKITHTRQMRPWYDDHTLWSDNANTGPRSCEHKGCVQEGAHRAPYSPQQTNKYRWFCLDHVREYNKSWDFAKGLGPDEIEQLIRFDTSWQRETRPLGNWRTKDRLLRARARHFAFGEEGFAAASSAAPQYTPKVAAALATFELDVMPAPAVLRARYHELAKKYHPDANGGDRKAEERLKEINQAYTALKEFLK